MHKKITPKPTGLDAMIVLFDGQFPHCDSLVLHAPGECEYCDLFPYLQVVREHWKIAFSGYEPDEKELPCPADFQRPGKSQLWGGNVAKKEKLGGGGGGGDR
jgi:hypothetical protein